jgi:xanthine dehydrogenase YagT iron-sulfur-binding subunit
VGLNPLPGAECEEDIFSEVSSPSRGLLVRLARCRYRARYSEVLRFYETCVRISLTTPPTERPTTPDDKLFETSVTNEKKKRYNEETQHSITGRVSRRSFLSSLGAAGVAATAGPMVATAQTAPPMAPTPTSTATETIEGAIPVSLRVNGKQFDLEIDPRTTLLDCLRETIRLTGTKKGCDHGQCGACTVHVNGRRINSCLTLAVMHEGDEVTTIEGLGQPGNLHPMQASFVKHDGYQCGYCTSGQIMSAVALLQEKCGTSDADVKELMSGNICRCGAYPNIVAAIQAVRRQA